MQKSPSPRIHSHQFDEGNPLAQKRILLAAILTALMMLLEVIGGWIFNSMALLADGWHMSSHMLALGLAYMAYRAARHYAQDRRFSFGTWKIEILAGYSSAILLLVVAAFMALHSAERLFNPVEIHYSQAIPIASAHGCCMMAITITAITTTIITGIAMITAQPMRMSIIMI